MSVLPPDPSIFPNPATSAPGQEVDERFSAARHDLAWWLGQPLALALALSSLLLMQGGSWLADAFQWEKWGNPEGGPWLEETRLWTGSVSFTLGALLLYIGGRHFLPVRHLRQRPQGGARRGLIMYLSPLSGGLAVDREQGRILLNGQAKLTLTTDLDQDLAAMAGLPGNLPHFLRALQPHRERLRSLVLIASPGLSGSAADAETYRWLATRYAACPPADFRVRVFETDPEQIAALHLTLHRILSELTTEEGLALAELAVDITGGPKTASIAAALVTLQNADLEFQYVSTRPPYAVSSFNMTAESPARFGG